MVSLSDDTPVAPPPAAPEASAPPAGAAAARLDQLAGALDRGGRAASAARETGGSDRVRAVTGNARRLRIEDLSFRYVDEVSPVDDRGRWTAAVDATWRYGGADPGTARAEVEARLVSEGAEAGGGVRILGFRPPAPGGRLPVWLAGPVTVDRSAQALVVAADGVPVQRYRRTARRAVREVRRVLPDWSGRLVVEVPADTAGVAAAIGADAARYASVAAVTATAGGGENPDAPVHVVVNPDVFAGLGARGAQVVMTHESVHVATGAASPGPRGVVPAWLLEGFADYVALRDVHLPVRRTAAQTIGQARQAGLPAALPGEQDFDATEDRFGAAYEASWLACRLIADVAGEAALVGLYDDVSSGGDLDAALRERAGLGVGDLTRRWRGVLARLAAGGPA